MKPKHEHEHEHECECECDLGVRPQVEEASEVKMDELRFGEGYLFCNLQEETQLTLFS